MHIVTVEKFWCCFRLELAGYVIGYFGALANFLGMIVAVVALGISVFVLPDNNRDEFLPDQILGTSIEDFKYYGLIKYLLDSQTREHILSINFNF